MAAYHARSNSFPSRQHPLVSEFDHQLSRLSSSQEASSSTSVACKLSGLQDLHDCVDQLLLLPLNQQALCSEHINEKRVEELLNGSLRILDICSTSSDALSQIKESTQQLQSILRRRRGADSDLTSEIKKFLASRKTVKKAIEKAMANRCSINRLEKHQKSDGIVSMLGEVESITLAVLESLFSFITGPKSQKSSSWYLVSRLMNSNKVVCEEVSEFESGVAALRSLISTPKMKKSDISLEENAQNELHKLEMCIHDLEEGVGSLYRCMIKTRVSLLNILSH